MYQRLLQERSDVSNMSTQDILQSDYKLFKMGKQGQYEVGIASSKIPFEQWSKKDNRIVEVTSSINLPAIYLIEITIG